ncbi:cyclic di-GMP phosphodiesterase Gmr [Mariprofundus micogutta]|uniref:Cyclic di-GMP phosphodiesterase Gmr n=1 Tax=Mariprofundus micogutta TaxID=1921010 RepID=A0A1L8CNH4_9PROT|nr:diguanylate cyclase [Mariprofundus micogutta]GAV20465.1 cyclic di-GMP phosphodiesterase Gmr [Mariprofundus micogutta]
MAIGQKMSQTELFSLFAHASNCMHEALDIPAILRASVSSAVSLVDARAGSAGLLVNDKLAFTEHWDGQTWSPMQCGFGAEDGWVGDLIRYRKPFIITEGDAITGFAPEVAPALVDIDQLIAMPIIGKQDDMLACLLVFDKNSGQFDAKDGMLLEQLASMVSVALENGIEQQESSRIEADLEKSVATYRTLVEQIPAITYIATLDRSRILFVSPQVEDILGYCQDDFLANQEMWSEQIHHEDHERVIAEVKQSLKDDLPFHSEYRICAKDGRDIWVKDAAATVRDHDQDLYLQGVVYDITERKQSEKKLLQMAHFDQLTGLANRSLFHDRLDQAVAQAKRHKQKLAVLYLDLDGFKAVNDALGHKAGDLLLAETARRLRDNVREVDTVARMGGDEFTIILNEIDSQKNISLVADKLIGAVSSPYEGIGVALPVTVSIGAAIYPDDSMHKDVLVTAADNAMYHAKNSGKNRCCFHLAKS